MIFGSTPVVQYERMRASGFRPELAAFFSVETTSAAAPSLMPDALPAVTVPSLVNAGLSAASFSAVVPARGYSSCVTRTGGPLLLRHFDGDDLPVEDAGVHRNLGPALALGGERVLVLARDDVAPADLLGGHAHVASLDRAGQAFLQHRVDDLGVAHPIAPARALQQIRGVAHRFGAAREHQVDVAGLDRFDGVHDRLKARAADAIDGFRRDLDRHARLDRRLARHVHAGARLQHAAHDHVADVGRVDAGARDGLANDDRAEVGGRKIFEGSAEGADRRPAGAENDGVIHAGFRIPP